jgi:hypothetical protein
MVGVHPAPPPDTFEFVERGVTPVALPGVIAGLGWEECIGPLLAKVLHSTILNTLVLIFRYSSFSL